MNQKSSFEESESLVYILLDKEMKVQRYSNELKSYLGELKEVSVGDDVRNSFPELVGLESICDEILSQKQDKFVLESIAREQGNTDIVYFNICIKGIEDCLLLELEDVTAMVALRQSFVQKANEVEITLNTLKRFEYCTNRIINSMGELLFITDSVGRIERVNSAVSKILGYRKSELFSYQIEELFPGLTLDFGDFYQLLSKRKYSIHKVKALLTSKQGKNLEVEFNCFSIPTDIPDLYSCVLIGRDITVRKQAEREILQALAKEKELRELKSRFISMASHEFRNPLSSILICADVLSNQNDDSSVEDRNFYLQLIKDSAMNIQSILEDVLVLSKAESGKQALKPTCFDLGEFCQQIIRELELSYPQRTINLIYDHQKLEYCGDTKLLWHIFTNLISNALKYSPESEPVEITIVKETESYLIEIRDRGIGIPQDAQKHLFESFYRANNVGETPGTGLGLAIVKRAIDLHQGRIEILSAKGQGTTIKLELSLNIDFSQN